MSEGLVAYESRKPLNVEAGVYPAKVKAIEDIDGQYGRQWQFTFELDDYPDEEPVAWASAKLGTLSKLYRWATALLGQPPILNEKLLPENLVGLPCRLNVSEKPGDDGKVVSYVSDLLPSLNVKTAPKAKAAKPEGVHMVEETCFCGGAVYALDSKGRALCEKHAGEIQQ